MTTDTVYRIRDVRKVHGPSFTLQISEMDVWRGEVVGLLGPIGAGKSTLLRLLAGLDNVTTGNIHFEDRPFALTDLPLAMRRRITMVHQRPLLLRGTVRSNVEYALRLRDRSNPARKAEAVLERLGLAKLASQPVHTLSGGQTQLVALARALVVQPEVLLLDEPTAQLDPAHITMVEEAVSQLRQEFNMTVVWSSHNVFQARRVADRAVLLLNGQLVEFAPAEAFFSNPLDPRTADFVQGRMVY
jgi:tungstate transport system ATP-binding protein